MTGNGDSMGSVLESCKLRSIDSSDIVNPVSGNRDSVRPVLGHCKLLPISQLEVNPALAFQMPLVVEELTGDVEVTWDSELVVYAPAQSIIEWESLSN